MVLSTLTERWLKAYELKGRLDAAVNERETTMQQAQELADKLTAANMLRNSCSKSSPCQPWSTG